MGQNKPNDGFSVMEALLKHDWTSSHDCSSDTKGLRDIESHQDPIICPVHVQRCPSVAVAVVATCGPFVSSGVETVTTCGALAGNQLRPDGINREGDINTCTFHKYLGVNMMRATTVSRAGLRRHREPQPS